VNLRAPLPRDLQAVVWLLFLNGLAAVAATVWNVAHAQVNIDLGLLAIPAAFGLRRHARGWRIFALIYLGLHLIAYAAVAAFMAFSAESFPIRISGFLVPWNHPAAVIAGSLALCLLHAWMIHVLTRRGVRALFASDDLAAA
jgi:hypothetical protein